MIEELAHHELFVTDEKRRNKQARAAVQYMNVRLQA